MDGLGPHCVQQLLISKPHRPHFISRITPKRQQHYLMYQHPSSLSTHICNVLAFMIFASTAV